MIRSEGGCETWWRWVGKYGVEVDGMMRLIRRKMNESIGGWVISQICRLNDISRNRNRKGANE